MKKYNVIIGESGVGGLGNPVNTCVLIYIGYCEPDGEISEEKGRALIPCTEEEYRSFTKSIGNYSVVQISAQRVEAKDDMMPYFNVGKVLELSSLPTHDEKMFLDKAQKPVSFIDDVFGKFKLDKRIGSFDGKVPYKESQIRVSLDSEKDIETLHKIYENIEEFISKASNYGAEELLDLGNDWCRDAWEDEEDDFLPMEIADFVNRISVTSIEISENGKFAIWYADGDIFWGHAICVEGNLVTGFADASMQG